MNEGERKMILSALVEYWCILS